MIFPERHLQKKACFTSPAGRKFALDDGAHLGRMDSVHPTRENLPSVFARAHKAVNLGRDDRISRNHALLLKEDGRWTIYDLNTISGTYINGVRIRPGEGVTLKKGDRIRIGCSEFIFSEEYPTINAAVLIGKPGRLYIPGVKNPTPAQLRAHLEGSQEDLACMREALVKRGFDDDHVITLYGRKATKWNILDAILSFEHELSKDSLFVFYYHGHGGWRHLCLHPFLSKFSDRYILGPDKLYDTLRELGGKKLVLLDCCNASSFLQDIPYRALVISGESPERYLYGGEVTAPLIHDFSNSIQYTRRNYRGFLTRSFLKALQNHVGSIDLKRIADELGGYKRLVRHNVEVFAEGNTVILPSIPGLSAAIRAEYDDNTHIFDLRSLFDDATRAAPDFPDGKREDAAPQCGY